MFLGAKIRISKHSSKYFHAQKFALYLQGLQKFAEV